MTKFFLSFLMIFVAGIPGAAQQGPATGAVQGTVTDKTGAAVVGAQVTLAGEGGERETATDVKGQFVLEKVTAGEAQIRVSARGFAMQQVAVKIGAGETVNLPTVVLELGRVTTDVTVSSKQTELAEAQIKDEEKQRLIGVVPNYYVSYENPAVALSAKQKVELGGKFTLDPISFLVTGAIAGVQQANNKFSGYGQGAKGYAKRYGAAYTNFFTSVMLSNVLLPSVFKQDPRYFVKGEGTTMSRIRYALAASFRCKGDNGRWQANYSEWLGNLGSAGLSNLYYPAKNRNGAELTFQNFGIRIGGSMAGNLFQEFASKKLTRKRK